jgi:hypothetical protein
MLSQVFKFCFKTGKTASETFRLIKQAYGDNAVSCTWDFEWYARFWAVDD